MRAYIQSTCHSRFHDWTLSIEYLQVCWIEPWEFSEAVWVVQCLNEFNFPGRSPTYDTHLVCIVVRNVELLA
jgi:hypothetical protein